MNAKTSNTNAQVGVLAVLNKPVNAGFADLVEARAAVAELIDRHERAVRWLEDIAAQRDLSDWGELCRRGHCPWQSVIDESHAALARCKGGAV